NELQDYEQAAKYARSAVKVNAKDSDAWRELGFAQLKMEDFEGAVTSLEKAIKLNPKDVSAHQYIVAAHKALGNDDEAADWQKKPTTHQAVHHAPAASRGRRRRKAGDAGEPRQAGEAGEAGQAGRR